MKMPTKQELIRLQRIYRSDKKIAEALGGIPEYLVAYWRRKKGISKPSFAKYSEAQIHELWERFGDDFHCGRELGVSKAAFYSWRRRYNIKEKPQALKLEQLELRFGMETKMGRNGLYVEYYQTAYQKILAKASGQLTIKTNDIIRATPDLMILPDSHALDEIDPKIGIRCWWVKPLSFISSASHAGNSSHVLDRCFEIFWRGQVKPNHFIVTTYPELHMLGAYSVVVLVLDEEHIAATLDGSVEMHVAPVIKVIISGRIPKSLSIVDLLGFFITKLTSESFIGKIIEFSGGGSEKLSGDDKMALCFLASLAGAEAGFCLFDESARKSLAQKTKVHDKILFSDRTAHYEAEYLLNTVGLSNYVFKDGDLSAPILVKDIDHIKPNNILIAGPCGGTYGALKSIADLAKNRSISKDTACYISPLTQNDLTEALKKKAISALVDFGCQILPVGMSLSDFLNMGKINGILLTVPDRFDSEKNDCEIIFSSAETAILSAEAGNIV
jgi:Aconitase family (aconitate hydratase)